MNRGGAGLHAHHDQVARADVGDLEHLATTDGHALEPAGQRVDGGLAGIDPGAGGQWHRGHGRRAGAIGGIGNRRREGALPTGYRCMVGVGLRLRLDSRARCGHDRYRGQLGAGGLCHGQQWRGDNSDGRSGGNEAADSIIAAHSSTLCPNDELHASTTLRAVAEQFPLRHATEAERTTILHLAKHHRIEPALAATVSRCACAGVSSRVMFE